MNDGVATEFAEKARKRRAISEIEVGELRAIDHRIAVSLYEVVDDKYIVSILKQDLGHDAPDVTRSARYSNTHTLVLRASATSWPKASSASSNGRSVTATVTLTVPEGRARLERYPCVYAGPLP